MKHHHFAEWLERKEGKGKNYLDGREYIRIEGSDQSTKTYKKRDSKIFGTLRENRPVELAMAIDDPFIGEEVDD